MDQLNLTVTQEELSLLLTGLDQLVRQGGLNAAGKALPLAAKLSEAGQPVAEPAD